MGFTILAYLKEESPPMTRESLKQDVQKWFGGFNDVVISDGYMPFNLPPSIYLLWRKKWGVTFFYDEDDDVAADTLAIQKLAGKRKTPAEFLGLRRRVRIGFGDWQDDEFEDEAVFVLEFIDTIPDAIVYDMKQKKFIAKA